MKNLFAILMLVLAANAYGQEMDSFSNYNKNSARTLIESKQGNLLMAAYGEVQFKQPFNKTTKYNGELNAERMVLLFGYKFNNKTTFISEIEIEDVKEVYLEQAFMNYQAKPWLNVQAGLILIPMGIINEYHEPTIFNGVNRPQIANALIPTTWREIGAGVTGNIPSAALRYQLYGVNGLLGYNNGAQLKGDKPMRGARQKGSQSVMTAPDLSAKINYYGIKNFDIGLATYIGTTESTLFNNVNRDSSNQLKMADSSVIGVRMLGADFRFKRKQLQIRGELFYSAFANTIEYNAFTKRDLGKSMLGYYLEVGYDVSKALHMKKKLIPFVRYSEYNTHNSVESGTAVNPSYRNEIITAGLGYFLDEAFVIKMDYEHYKNGNDVIVHQINAGLGFWFR
jgi:hypothetical protein